MGLIRVELFSAASAPALDLPTLSQQELKKGVLFRLNLPLAAQERFFGGALDPDRDALALQLADSGQERLLIGIAVNGGALPLSAGPRGSVYLKLRPWTATPKGKRPPERLRFASKVGAAHLFHLPQWAYPMPAKPGAGKGLMDD